MSTSAAIAERLRAEAPRILRCWEQRVRSRIAAARGESTPVVLDTLPATLAALADDLEHPGAPRVEGAPDPTRGAVHGGERATLPSYSLEAVVDEYQLLRQVLFEVLEESGPLDTTSRDAILDGLQTSVRNAAREFERARCAEAERVALALQASHASLEQRVRERTEELTTSEERFRLFVAGVRDYALFTLDCGGVITSWNEGAERMKGYTAREAIGEHFRLLYPADGRARREPEEHLVAAEREGRYRGEGMRQRKDGALFVADVLITPMYRGHTLIGFSKVVQDLTERSVLVRERDQSRTAIENFRVEREVRERFIAMLSHDLRTPLSAAKMSAQLILRRPDAHERHMELAARVVSNLDRLDTMVKNLLDVSRVRGGQGLGLDVSCFELRSLAERVAEELATVYGDRFVVHGDTVEGYWSREGLVRVLENLATNAAKYGESGTPITVSVHRGEHRVAPRVINLGRALAPEEQAGLFEHFSRGPQAEAGGQPGWGIGLTVVRAIVEALGGTVGVTSTAGTGTTFVVDLPIDARPFANG